MRRPPHTQARGFTLLELMITIAILAILLAIAIPSFQGLMASNRLTGATNDFIAALNTARAEAIRRGQRITLCASTDGTTCAASTTNNDWSTGWLLFNDIDKDNALDTNETVQRVGGPSSTGIILTGNFGALPADRLRFLPDGTTGGLNGHVSVLSNSTALTQNVSCIIIHNGGRTRVTKPTTHDGACP